jgi:hypothetical protein
MFFITLATFAGRHYAAFWDRTEERWVIGLTVETALPDCIPNADGTLDNA